jgi:predicted nucleic acid-binding protein
MKVLVDTSVWVAHFRHANLTLVDFLERDRVLGHPLVLAEIACGTPPAPRDKTLEALALLALANQASTTEVMAFIERKKLFGLGCGYVDIALLASTCITPEARLWTLDKRLMDLSRKFELEFALPLH